MITKSIRFENELYEKIVKLAEKENRNFSNMVVTLLDEKFDVGKEFIKQVDG